MREQLAAKISLSTGELVLRQDLFIVVGLQDPETNQEWSLHLPNRSNPYFPHPCVSAAAMGSSREQPEQSCCGMIR